MVQVQEPQDYVDVLQSHRGGFSFENCKRNAYLAAQAGIKPPTAMKSGTTICGIVVKDAVILAADTRATNGPMVADKNCEKLHYIAKNIFCAGAGTAADLMHTTEMMESQIELLRMATGTQPRVCTVVKRLSSMLFKYLGFGVPYFNTFLRPATGREPMMKTLNPKPGSLQSPGTRATSVVP